MSILNQTFMPIIIDSSSSGPITQNDINLMISILIGMHMYVFIVIFCIYLYFRIKNKKRPVKIKFKEFWGSMSLNIFDMSLSSFLVFIIMEAIALLVVLIDVLLLFSWFGILIYNLFK